MMGRPEPPRLETGPETFERSLLLAAGVLLAAGIWAGGAFDHVPYLHAAKGTGGAFLGKFLVWDHNALTKVALNPFLARPYLFLLGASALALGPVVFGMSCGRWKSRHEALLWLACIALALGLAFLLPLLLLPPSLSAFEATYWRVTSLAGTAALAFVAGLLRVAGPSMRARDILRQPHAYDLMDLSGAATLEELKRTGLLIRSDFWPSPDAKTLEGRLAIGRLYDDGRPTAFFVAPEIAKL
ncbi:MAG: hypothetical protein ACOYXN_06655, partial [Acidobacteriota bacterium]